MKVLLDANAIISNLRFRGPAAESVLAVAAEEGTFRLVTSEVILAEVTNHFREQLSCEAEKMASSADRLASLLGFRPELPELRSEWIDEQVREYDRWIRKTLGDVGVVHRPYPNISHAATTIASIDQVRPFKKDDKGYRDYLIWGTVLELIEESDEDVVLVTSDGVFYEDKHLHPELQRQVLAIGGAPNQVVALRTVDAFYTAHVEPELQARNEVLGLVCDTNTSLGKRFAEWLENNAGQLLVHEPIPAWALGLSPDWPYFYVTVLRNVEGLAPRRAVRALDDSILVVVDVSVAVQAEAWIPKILVPIPHYYGTSITFDLDLGDFVTATTDAVGTASFRVSVDPSAQIVLGGELIPGSIEVRHGA